MEANRLPTFLFSKLRDEVDIFEFDKKYYLFGMKSEADLRQRPVFLQDFREYRECRTKSKNS